MPGAPSSLGCDGCRKAKKACDQLKPRCSRCIRLFIPCIGAGQKRFMFKDATQSLKLAAKSSRRRKSVCSTISRSTSSEETALSSFFVSAMEVTDVRYEISSHIPFARFIPQRLGRHAALDSAVRAITCAHSDLCRGTFSIETAVSYDRALGALRICLDDPKQTNTVETLATVYLMMMFHLWIGRRYTCNKQHLRHAQILVHMLNAAVPQGWDDDFDSEVIITTTYIVLSSSAFNSTIRLDPWYPKVVDRYPSIQDNKSQQNSSYPANSPLEHCESDGLTAIMTMDLPTLDRVTTFLHRPENNFMEIQAIYQAIPLESEIFQKPLHELRKLQFGRAKISYSTIEATMLLRSCQIACGLLLSLALLLNAILKAFDTSDPLLIADSDTICLRILEYGQHLAHFRPMGANFIPASLSIVIGSTDNATILEKAETMMKDYSTDFKGMKYAESAVWLKTALQTLRTRIFSRHETDPWYDDWTVIGNNTPEIWQNEHDPSSACFVQ